MCHLLPFSDAVPQDALKKRSNDELPDFYNIQLERPKDDPGGYDCLFIDAASKVGSLSSIHILTRCGRGVFGQPFEISSRRLV